MTALKINHEIELKKLNLFYFARRISRFLFINFCMNKKKEEHMFFHFFISVLF